MIPTVTLVFAMVFIAFGASPLKAELQAAEREKIDAFLNRLSAKTDLTFVRNGTNYKVDKAVAHLKTKLKRAGNRISTCQEFIDHLASKSSISGKPYLIIKADGATVEAREYFSELLKQIEAEAAL